MSKRNSWIRFGIVAGAFCIALAAVVPASAYLPTRKNSRVVFASLDGFQEVPAAIFTSGDGLFRARLRDGKIEYLLGYSDLTGDVTAAAGVHIHFGRPGVNGGIAAFLCEAAGVPAPPGTPPCTDDGTGSGFVTGTLTDADVLAIEGQGFPGGSIDDLWRILVNKAAYINLHTSVFPGGEIRGAVKRPSFRR